MSIDVSTVRNVLRIPNAALRFKPATESGAAGSQPAVDPAQRAARSGQAGGPAGAASQLPRGRRGAKAGGGLARPQTVYILGPDKKPRPVDIRTGITDGRFTQIVSGDLKEGDQVVVGLATSKVEGPPPMGGQGGPGGGGQRNTGGRRG